MMKLNENNIVCMYGGKRMTVAEYRTKRGVAEFETKLRDLAMTSANCRADRTDVMTDKLYPIFNAGFPTHQNRRCLYFERNVLPSDPKLEADYWNLFEGGKVSAGDTKGTCQRCNVAIIKTSNRQKYCEECSHYVERERKRAYYHKRNE